MAELTYRGYDRRHVPIAIKAIPTGARRPVDVRVMLEEVRRLCARYDLNFGLIWAQIVHETGDFSSDAWNKLHNPAGIKTTSGEKFVNYYNGVDAARAMLSHVASYINAGEELTPIINPDLDPRSWIVRGIARETPIADRAKLSTVAKSWAEDSRYEDKVRAIYTRTFLMDDPALLPVLIVAGHRNLSGGNPDEASRTDDLARAYLDAFRARGIRAEWWQQIDGDSDPDDTQGSLAAVAVGCNEWLARQPQGGVMLDLHFEGGGQPGVFTIFPDWPGDRNPLDQRWAGIISGYISMATGLKRRESGVVFPGVMSERQTGVGGQGYRLGMFNLTASQREKSIRLIIEHGSLDKEPDASIIKSSFLSFCEKSAKAAAAAIVELQR